MQKKEKVQSCSKEKYDREALKLADLFINNFNYYISDQPELIKYGPVAILSKQEA